ncbi:MAG: RNB domain-containing ribonuclease [Cyanobium sp. M30B3]|nr:MAG: RNB domain-containing ribonuclease [Cyanobium sp. M30B3]
MQASRLQLAVGPTARAQLVPQRDVELICPLPAGADPPLRLGVSPWTFSPEQLATALPPARERATAWLLLQDDPGDGLDLAGWCDLVAGSQTPAALAAAWLWLHGDQLWFRLRQQRISARAPVDLHQLRQARHRQRRQQRQERAWQEILRARQPFDPGLLEEHQRRELQLLEQWASGDSSEPLPPALRQALQAAHCQAETGAIRHLLVDLGRWQPHHLPSLSCSSWELGFSPELEAEATRLLAAHRTPQPGDERRLDLCGQHCLTIDDDDTEDIDDGLALERLAGGGERLWIHVADPGRLVPMGSPLDLEARRRGTSLYLARGTLPMFPLQLSTGPFSLRAGHRCAAWSVWVELDAGGAVAASGVERSWVKPAYRLSYADADELIELAPPEEPDPAALHALLLRRRQWRLARGALLLDQPEGRIREAAGEPRLEISDPGAARSMVAEAMILAGAVVAELGREHQLALPYRSQLPAALPPASELDALPAGPVRHAAIKRCLSRGISGSQPAPHFSLGLPAYVQATSPIRRYGDLMVQRQLLALKEGQAPLSGDQLLALLAELESPLRQAAQISRDDQRHWQQVWFDAHRGQAWRAQFLRWLRPQDQLGLVHVEELAMDLAAECPVGSEPGLQLMLRVHQVDPLRDLLRLITSR